MCAKTLRLITLNFLIVLMTLGCSIEGDYSIRGDKIEVLYAGDFSIVGLSREETQSIALEVCKKRFGSETVTWKPGKCYVTDKRCSTKWSGKGGTGFADTYICDAPIAKTNYRPEEKETIDTKLNTAKQKCKDRNLTPGTEEFGKCVLKLSE